MGWPDPRVLQIEEIQQKLIDAGLPRLYASEITRQKWMELAAKMWREELDIINEKIAEAE